MNVRGYPQCRRRRLLGKDGYPRTVKDGRQGVEDIVPYNARLLLEFACHINLEVCTSIRAVKYVYKYKKYYKVFKPINPFEYCKCCECCKTSNNNTISKSKESKLSGESKKNIKDLIETENKIIITNVKHPDDILI